MRIEGALRTRVLFGAAVLAGVFAGLIGTFMLMSDLPVPALYAAFGGICGVQVVGVLWREVGPVRALGLALATAALAGLLMFALGQGACALSSCAR
ncbi:MAG: hypothetical protein ACXVFM_13915 [Solirubrobacteraceae bacterium]